MSTKEAKKLDFYCVFLCFTVLGQDSPVRHMRDHQCSCRTDTLLECLPDYHALYRWLTCDGRGLEVVPGRIYRLCDTLLALR